MSSKAQRECLAIICVTPAICGIFLALRIYSRRIRRASLSWDDWFVIVAWLLTLALIPPSWIFVKTLYYGMYFRDIPPEHWYPDYRTFYYVLVFFNVINTPIVPLCKASIIALLLRVEALKTSLRFFLWAVQVFNMLFLIVPWVWMMFECPMLTNTTSAPRLGKVHCISRQKIGTLQLVNNCANLVTDVLVFPIPFLIVTDMFSANLRKRFKMLFGFAFILGGTICTVFKIKFSQGSRNTNNQDWMHETITFTINHIENCVSIIIANVLTLHPVLSRWRAKFPKSDSDPIQPHPHAHRPSNIMLSLNTWRGTKSESVEELRCDEEKASNTQCDSNASKSVELKETEVTPRLSTNA